MHRVETRVNLGQIQIKQTSSILRKFHRKKLYQMVMEVNMNRKPPGIFGLCLFRYASKIGSLNVPLLYTWFRECHLSANGMRLLSLKHLYKKYNLANLALFVSYSISTIHYGKKTFYSFTIILSHFSCVIIFIFHALSGILVLQLTKILESTGFQVWCTFS